MSIGTLRTAEVIPQVEAIRDLLIRSDKAPVAGWATEPVSRNSPNTRPALAVSKPANEIKKVGSQAQAAEKPILAKRDEIDKTSRFLSFIIVISEG
jgi:hypothetical protein